MTAFIFEGCLLKCSLSRHETSKKWNVAGWAKKCANVFSALFPELYLTIAVYLSSVFAIHYGNVRVETTIVSYA